MRKLLPHFLLLVIVFALVAVAISSEREGKQATRVPLDQLSPTSALSKLPSPKLSNQREPPGNRAGIDTTSPTPTASPSPAVDSRNPNGVIKGFVRDDIAMPVSEIPVRLYVKDTMIASTHSQEGGNFRFEGLGPAKYIVRIHSEELLEHYLGPWRQHATPAGKGNKYQSKSVKMPETGGAIEVELRVFRKSVAWGRLIGATGDPVVKALVRLQGFAASGQPSSLCADGITDEEGKFNIIDVYPGLYVLSTFATQAESEHHRTQWAPIPRAVEIFGGGEYDLGTIQLGGGKNTVRGRVLDEKGMPFKGLNVIAFPAESPGEGYRNFKTNTVLSNADTDSDGYYCLEQLPNASVNIRVGTDYREKPLGEAQAAFWIAPQVMNLAGGKEFSAQDSILPRSRPFRIFGAVSIDEAWTTKTTRPYDGVSLEFILVDPNEPMPANRPGHHMYRIHEVDPVTGAFEVLLETPHRAVKAQFTWRHGRPRTVEKVIYNLSPNGQLELFPSFEYASN